MEDIPFTGEVVDVQHVGGSVTLVTTVQTITAYFGTCDNCHKPSRVDTDKDEGKTHVIECVHCGGDVVGDRLVATYTDEECADNCRHAHSNICHCTCGGVNHGRIWCMRIDSGEMTEDEALEQLDALLKFYASQRAVLNRRKEKIQENTNKRQDAFEEWIGEHEELVHDILACDDPAMDRYKKMVENDEMLSVSQCSTARRIIRSAGSF